jgi:hypothetical protein
MDLVDPFSAMPLMASPCSYPAAVLSPICLSPLARKKGEPIKINTSEMEVFPSMTSSEITIRSSPNQERCCILNVLGVKVTNDFYVVSEYKLNVSSMESGLYFVVSKSGKSVKFVKQ